MKYWLVVPAAGIGARFGGALPKQYSQLSGRTVLEHSLERLMTLTSEAIIVALHPADVHWQALSAFDNRHLRRVEGGDKRSASVLCALNSIRRQAAEDDWVLVHDAVRPCVAPTDLNKLLLKLGDSPVGGLLATPVSATLKLVMPSGYPSGTLIGGGDTHTDAGGWVVDRTVDREGLWLAGTPQMFRYGLLLAALNHCAAQGLAVTDEAEAIELYGSRPVTVQGRSDNIKITHAEDLLLAELILQAQRLAQESRVGITE